MTKIGASFDSPPRIATDANLFVASLQALDFISLQAGGPNYFNAHDMKLVTLLFKFLSNRTI